MKFRTFTTGLVVLLSASAAGVGLLVLDTGSGTPGEATEASVQNAPPQGPPESLGRETPGAIGANATRHGVTGQGAAVDGISETVWETLLDDIADFEWAALHGSDLRARLVAVYGLSLLDGEQATDSLLFLALDTSLPVRVRRTAILLLGQRGDDAVGPVLFDLLSDQEKGVRLAAVQALGGAGPGGALEYLSDAYENDSDPGVRGAALQAIARIGTPEAVETLLGLYDRTLVGASGNADPIAATLGVILNPASAPALVDAASWRTHSVLYQSIIESLARTGDPAGFEVLLQAVGSAEDRDTRCEAMQGLGLIGDSRALPTLRERDENGDEKERLFARTAIDRITR